MTRVLLLVPTTSYRVGDFMAAAETLGIEVTVGADRRQAAEALAEGRTLTLDFRNVATGTEQIVSFARTYPVAAIVAADESATLLAAQAAAALGLAHNAPDAVAAAGNKYAMRKAFAAAGLPSPAFGLVGLDEDGQAAARGATYPCVLKPLALSASRGVIRADDTRAFAAAFARIKALLATARAPARPDLVSQLLVESYIPGIEVALEGLLVAGSLQVLALFDKPDALEGPYFEETIYLTPSRVAAPVQADIAAAARRAAAALGLSEGPVHAEFRVNDAGVWVLEMAARSIGGLCARALRFGAGLSLEELILRHALGLPVAKLARESRAAGVMMIPIPGAGILRAVDGEIEARGVPGIEDVRITIPVGQPVVPLPEGHRYLGFLFARGETPEAVERALREAHRRLHFTITR